MSQNSKNLHQERIFCFIRKYTWLLLLLLTATPSVAQHLLQTAGELSALLRSDTFIPRISANSPFTLYLDNKTQEIAHREMTRLDKFGYYQISFLPGQSHQLIVQLGASIDTIYTSQSVQIINQSGYFRWQALGRTDTLASTLAQIECTLCKSELEINGADSLTTFTPKDTTVLVAGIPVAPYERLVARPFGKKTIVQVRGENNTISKPTQRLLEIWYQHIAYQDPNWQKKSLAALRQELAGNPFLPPGIIDLIPDSPVRLSTYLPPSQRPNLPDWQDRLYRTKKPYDIALQPELNYTNIRQPAMPANRVAAQQAQGIYQADERLGFQLGQQQMLKGLTAFIEERAQEELNIVFLERMQRQLKEDSILLTLFPHTAQLFEQFELNHYRFVMDNAKAVFTSDLSNLGLNLYKVFELENLKEDFQFSSELYFAALVLKMINMVYLDVPTDTILVNSYLALEQQADLLDLQLLSNSAAQLQQDSSTRQRLIGSYQNYINSQQQMLLALNQQVDQLRRLNKQLIDRIANTHPLYNEVWNTNDQLAHLQEQIDRQQQHLQQESSTIIDLLSGIPTEEYILQHSNLANYSRFFSVNADSLATVRIHSGLNSLATVLKAPDLTQLNNWEASTAYLSKMLLETLIQWQQIQDEQLQRRSLAIYLAYQTLERALLTEINWWTAEPSSKQPLLAIKFLLHSLSKDNTIWQNYQDLEQYLLQDITDFSLVKNVLPLLEQQLRDTYYPLLLENTNRLRAQKDTVARPVLQQEARWFAQSFVTFEQLFQEKQANPEALDDYMEELSSFFPNLARNQVTKAQIQAFENPYLTLLDSLIRFSQLNEQSLRNDFKRLDDEQDALTQQRIQTSRLHQQLEQQLDTIAVLQANSVLLQSSRRIRGVTKVFAVGNHIVQALRTEYSTPDSEQKWIDFATLQQTFQQDSLQRGLFFGLLFESLRNLPDLQKGTGGSQMQPDQVASLSIHLLKGMEQIQQLETKRKQLRLQGEQLTLQDYSALVLQTVNIVQQLFTSLNNENTNGADQQLLHSGQQILTQSSQLYQNLIDTQYTMAIANLAAMVQTIIAEQNNKNNKLERENQRFQNQLLNYGSFMAAVALAKTPKQVKTALELASVEVGSSRVKRINNWNVSLNAYLGLGVGFEQQPGMASGLQLNLATPVGLSISKGIKGGHSLSLFGSVLDLGPIVTYDFNQESTFTGVDFKFENFVTPGAFIFWNIASSPFTTGIGIQRTAKIRQIAGNPQNTTRLLGTFLIDIPVFNLFTHKN